MVIISIYIRGISMKQHISAEAFEKSIRTSLSLAFDYDAACRRVAGRLNNLPEGNIYIRKDRNQTAFYEIEHKKQKYLSKKSDRTYLLARKKYLEKLQKILDIIRLHRSPLSEADSCDYYSDIEPLKDELVNLIYSFSAGNLDVARIVMTPAQYKWYTGKFIQKKNDYSVSRTTNNDIHVRSKSEQDIGNIAEELGAFYHYEERMRIDVRELVQSLSESLKKANIPISRLYNYNNNSCHWNVPIALEWMNSSGSIWRAYNDRTGKITIYNDFKFMLADSEIIIWEHSGLADKFKYRCNASEREYVLEYTKTVRRSNYINTFEDDIKTDAYIIQIIKEKILPRLWF